MELSLRGQAPDKIDTPCLVVDVFESAALQGAAAILDKASGGRVTSLIESGDVDARFKQITLLHGFEGVAAQRVLFVGCGKSDEFDRFHFHTACMAAGERLRDMRVTEAHLCLNETPVKDTDANWRTRQAAIAIDRANYLYTATKPVKPDAPSPLTAASFQGGDKLQAALDQAAGIAAGYRRARELGNLPPNLCNPAYLAEQARAIADRYEGAEVEILDRKALAKLGMNALLGVAQGSAFEPYLIVLKYTGASPQDAPHVFVGKGITFDSGGLSLKAPQNMDQMKFDMCGAAGVLGAFEACAFMQLPVNLITVVATAENMPDGRAYRPGDVLTSLSGKTIEVLNTDAEGRLVLCDALHYCQQFKPCAMVDVATLTGACVVALGHHASGLMSHHDDLAEALVAAGHTAVDRAWRLPIWEEYQSQLDSPFADMKNVGGMPAGAVTAGCFLARFTEGQRWAHLDIAGSAWKWGETEGATGRPVGLLSQYLIDQAG